jgi:thioredoxin 1
MLSLMLYALVGTGLGAAMGFFGQCSSGTCPLTSTWWRGAIYGAALGGLFYFVSGQNGSASMNESTDNVKRITQDQFEAEVTQGTLPVVVDFYATWCGPCKRLAPKLDGLAGSLSGRIKFVKVNVDESPELARRFQIEGIPTLLFFKNGQVADRLVGLPAEDALKTRLESLAAGAGVAAAAPGSK